MGFSKYNFSKIEAKWRVKWRKTKIFSAKLDLPQENKTVPQKPFYNLMMFPYPSAEGLHVGNVYAFVGADIYGRYMRMKGFEVFEPIGLDGFGIHSENYAIKIGKHPADLSKITERRFYKQLEAIGNAYDWERILETYDPDYYRWTQWLFIQMFKNGLAYRGKAFVNWCPSCKTVLADEQVIGGNCERCGNQVQMRELEQWFFRITKYAERLLNNLSKLDWSQKVKNTQRNWIGKSDGAEIEFRVLNKNLTINVFTTRPDTLYGVTFLAIPPSSKLIPILTRGEQKNNVSEYLTKRQRISEHQKDSKGKSGVFTGSYAINPATGEQIPIWLADYVLEEYGLGAVMGVPACDKRDYEFAKKYSLPIKQVVAPIGRRYSDEPYTDFGEIVNSGSWTGLRMPQDKKKILDEIEKNGWGRRKVFYHLRDWLISRQRYWGPPIPMIFCQNCKKSGRSYFTEFGVKSEDFKKWDSAGWYPVSEADLPVRLPYIRNYRPTGSGVSPLASDKEWMRVKCPGCGQEAKRETDVSDTFLDSSWYFLRYLATERNDLPFPSEKFDQGGQIAQRQKNWLPVDMYIGGAEHAVLHLMYSRFITMALYDWAYLDFEEPFERFYAHGLLIKEGAKMSKSKGNVVIPDMYIKKFGADTLRSYLMFLGPFDQGGDFRDTGIEGMHKFIKRIWELVSNFKDLVLIEEEDTRQIILSQHRTVKEVSDDLQNLRFNTAISVLMEYVNLLRKKALTISSLGGIGRTPKKPNIRCAQWDEALRTLVLLIAPFMPFLAEELWVSVLGQRFSVHLASWPQYDSDLAKLEKVEIVIQIDGKVRGRLMVDDQVSQNETKIEEMARKEEKIGKWLAGKRIKKTVFVSGRLINFVTL